MAGAHALRLRDISVPGGLGILPVAGLLAGAILGGGLLIFGSLRLLRRGIGLILLRSPVRLVVGGIVGSVGIVCLVPAPVVSAPAAGGQGESYG